MLTSFAEHLVRHLGDLGIFVGMVAESAGVPLPSEVIMPLGGLLSTTPGALERAVAAGTAGNLVGSWIAYGIGAGLGSEWRGSRLLSREHWEQAHAWFARHGAAAVLVGRVLPVVRTYISFPAGAARMPVGTFSLFTALGSLVWSAALALAGYTLRAHWQLVVHWVNRYTLLVLPALLLALAAWWWLQRRRRGASPAPK